MKKQNSSFKIVCLLIMLVGSTSAFAQADTTGTLQQSNSSGTLQITPIPDGGIRLNFRNAPVDTVIDYLSKAAGFVIIRNVEVEGRVDIVSHQPLNKEEAVNLLNSVLYEKGYAAIRDDRTLTIVGKDEAKKRSIPVILGNDPDKIPKNDIVVTQIIPVRYIEAAKLIDNVKPLMDSNATISANETSNAIVLTDTQKRIRRIVEIIKALDTSISDITTLKVFLLNYSDAKDMAKMINSVFEIPKTNTRSSGRSWGGPFGGRGGGDNGSQNSSTSVALQSTRRVKAVADERTNAVVVSAPEEYMPSIEKLITDTDMSDEMITEFHVFPLKYAKAEEMAETLNSIFSPDQQSSNNRSSSRSGGREEFFRRMMGRSQQSNRNNQQVSQRELQASEVSCVADDRTNSVIVSAEKNLMPQVEKIIQRLDSKSGKNQKVFVYSLDNAEAENVADILDSMFNGGSGNRGGSNNNSSRTNTNTRNNNTSTRNNNFGRN